jgi:branched-chain amino acid transport system permease protein
LDGLGGLLLTQANLDALVPQLRLVIFGGLIIFFLIVEPDGLARLWRNIRNYFRLWPFSY